jgi:hypothetical protein
MVSFDRFLHEDYISICSVLGKGKGAFSVYSSRNNTKIDIDEANHSKKG